MTVIQIEGCDGTFKSTVAEKLSDMTGLEIIKGSSFELSQCANDKLNHFFTSLMSLDDIIIDRSIYSNLVYASLYKDYAILNPDQVNEIEKIMKRRKVKTAFLYASPEVVKQRLSERGDDYVKADMVDSILEKYFEVMRNAKSQIIWYDTEQFNSDEIANELYTYFK